MYKYHTQCSNNPCSYIPLLTCIAVTITTQGGDDESDGEMDEAHTDPPSSHPHPHAHAHFQGVNRPLSAERQGLGPDAEGQGLGLNTEGQELGPEDLALALLDAQQSPSASMYHRLGVGVGVGVGDGEDNDYVDHDDMMGGPGPGQGGRGVAAMATTPTRRLSVGTRSGLPIHNISHPTPFSCSYQS